MLVISFRVLESFQLAVKIVATTISTSLTPCGKQRNGKRADITQAQHG